VEDNVDKTTLLLYFNITCFTHIHSLFIVLFFHLNMALLVIIEQDSY